MFFRCFPLGKTWGELRVPLNRMRGYYKGLNMRRFKNHTCAFEEILDSVNNSPTFMQRAHWNGPRAIHKARRSFLHGSICALIMQVRALQILLTYCSASLRKGNPAFDAPGSACAGSWHRHRIR
jgi:hypothetical protein